MERPVLSASQIQAYLACPLKYRFQYVDRIERPWRAAALAFGTSVHAAIEAFHRSRMNGGILSLEGVLATFEADWYAENLGPLVFAERESKEGLCEKGREMLAVYLAAQDGAPPPAAIEEPFEVELFDPETGEVLEVAFRGYIDLVEADGTVVDLKTAARSLDAGGLERHLQLSCYALVALLQTGRVPPLRLDVLSKTKQPRFERLPTTRSRADLAWTARLIREVAAAIETEHFFPSPGWPCSTCEYYGHCQRWRGDGHLPPPTHQIVQLEQGGGVGPAAA
jgi:putative RecB family exonuclease